MGGDKLEPILLCDIAVFAGDFFDNLVAFAGVIEAF